MIDDEDFSKTPLSIGEIRSDRSGHAKGLTAREMLVSLLRDIDSDQTFAPDFAIVFMAKRAEDGAMFTNERVGGVQNSLEVYGLIERCKARLIEDSCK